MKKLRLLQDWGEFKAGTLLEVDEGTAADLIAANTAKEWDPAAEAAEKKAAEDAVEAERVRIEEVVKASLDAAQKAHVVVPPNPGTTAITRVHENIEDDPKGGFKSFGEHLLAVRNAGMGQEHDVRLKAPSGMSENVDADGGFLVPAEFRAELLKKTYDAAQVAGRCRRIPMATNQIGIPYIAESSRADGCRSGAIRAYWLAEAASKTASQPKFGKINLKLDKLAAFVYATDELLSDSVITMDALINELVSEEFAFVIDDAIIEGTGAGMPLGILVAPCLVTVPAEGGQLPDTIWSQNIVNMWARLYARGRGNAVWYINQDIEPQLQQMTLGAGASPLVCYMPPGGLSGAPYATLMGRPVIAIEQCSTLGDLGDIILADMTQYLIGQKTAGIESAVSIHYRFIYDETTFRFVMRIDGQPWWATALTPFKGTATQSPFVTLAAR